MSVDPTIAESGECDSIDPLLSAWVDGEVFGDDRARVERHVAGCARCRAAAADYRVIGATLSAATHRAAARDLSAIAWPPRPSTAPVHAELALTPRRRLLYDVARWFNPWPVYAGAVAMVALIVGIGVWRPAIPEALVEIERLDAAGPVMVLTGGDGRTTIIWLVEPEVTTESETSPI
ncbi:MAG: zf-HC2 domain-containing protein [Nitrospirota bacterium]